MRKPQKVISIVLAMLTLAALAAVVLTWQWADYRAQLRTMQSNLAQHDALVDRRALDTAEQLSQLAETRREKAYAQEALRLADYSVDAAFASAIQDAAQNPAPLTPETCQITDRLRATEVAVAADQGRIAQLNQQLAKANAKTKDSFQEQLSLVQAQLELDQDELDDAHQDLIRAGGDHGDWINYLTLRKRAFEHGIFLAVFWILVIALFVFGANAGAQRFFSDLSPERRELQKMRTVALFGVQALGVILILLVVFGKPTNFATVVALAGAGLTVALKDFIVGFFGWFVLMGKDGIRPGDWVEINGGGRRSARGGLIPHRAAGNRKLDRRGAPNRPKNYIRQQFCDRGPLHQFLDIWSVAVG
jgi:hypothetical protein